MMTSCSYRLGVIAVAFILAGCGGSGALRDYRALKVPPGISPLVAAHADSIAAGLFVTMKNEREAQSFLKKAGNIITSAIRSGSCSIMPKNRRSSRYGRMTHWPR